MMTHGTLNGSTIRRVLMALAVVGSVAAAGPASAHDDGWRHEDRGHHYGWQRHGWHERGPVYYEARPRLVYEPPPVVYLREPRPVYQPPSISFVFPLR